MDTILLFHLWELRSREGEEERRRKGGVFRYLRNGAPKVGFSVVYSLPFPIATAHNFLPNTETLDHGYTPIAP